MRKNRIRLAVLDDLSAIQEMYTLVVEQMYTNHIYIWDDIYPCRYLKKDIEEQALYVMENDQGKILASAAFYCEHPGHQSASWNYKGDYMYMDRLAVHPAYSCQGVGSYFLQEIVSFLKQQKISCIRLFVVDTNKPAIRFYQKNGFTQACGIYKETIDDELCFHEYGFEKRI